MYLKRVLEGTIIKHVFVMIMIIGLTCVASGSSSAVEKYPARSVEIVVGSPPGGPADPLTRMLGRYFEKYVDGLLADVSSRKGAAGECT